MILYTLIICYTRLVLQTNESQIFFLSPHKAAALSLSYLNCLLCSLSNTTVLLKMQKPELHAAPKIRTKVLQRVKMMPSALVLSPLLMVTKIYWLYLANIAH